MKQTKRWPTVAWVLLLMLAAAAALWIFNTSLVRLEAGQAEQGRQQLEQSLRRAAVACYAAEGAYPADLAYLEQHYGVQIDTGRYTVYYDIFAGNIMPDITVLEKES